MVQPIRQDRAAQGELFIWTDIDPAYENDFNQWYDREHMEERAAIPGFKWARRYKRPTGDRRYLAVYRTESVDVFTSEKYRQAFESQTEWSITNFGRMRNTNRRVMVVSPLAGVGTGAAVALIPLGNIEAAEKVAQIAQRLIDDVDGVLSLRVLTPEPELSTPLPSENTENRVLEPILLVDTTTEPVAATIAQLITEELGIPDANTSTFSLLWDLRSADLTS